MRNLTGSSGQCNRSRSWIELVSTASVTLCFLVGIDYGMAQEPREPNLVWTKLNRWILETITLPEPVAYPLALPAAAEVKGLAKDFIRANDALLSGDTKLACSLYQALINSQPDSRLSPVYYFNWGVAAMKAGDLTQARWAFRNGIGILNRQEKNQFFDEIASRDLPIEGFALRSYHFYVNLCWLYHTDATYQETERLVGEIRKQGRSNSLIYPYLKTFLEHNGSYPAHLLWALSNYERLLRYPPHCRHPIIRYNTALALLKMGAPEPASQLLDLNTPICGADTSDALDATYLQRTSTETAEFLPTVNIEYVRGVAAAMMFKNAEAQNLLLRVGPKPGVQSVLTYCNAMAEIFYGSKGGFNPRALDQEQHYRHALDAIGVPVEEFQQAVILKLYGDRINAVELLMSHKEYRAALKLIGELKDEINHPVFAKMMRLNLTICSFRDFLKRPLWIGTLIGLILLPALVIKLVKTMSQFHRITICSYQPEPKHRRN